ncbi:MAG: ABC transporter permease subunit [Clostridiaceae bacterium]|nr:ABC transporter permease subunit [Clostridiaceae bacterium]
MESTTLKPRKSQRMRIWENRWVYLFLLPGLVFLVVFSYWPMYGLTLAFKDFQIGLGIFGSRWANPWYKHFISVTQDKMFWSAFMNTFRMGFWYILTSFPAPILLALMINELRGTKYKKLLQTVYTFPNFLSWVVVGGLMLSLLSSEGLVNMLIRAFGGSGFDFLANRSLIRPMLYTTNVWKCAGWDAILYLAAIAGINPELYEAADVDGANRFHKMLYITWPGIKSTAVILLILSFGSILNNGFDQILNMVNSVVQNDAETMDTYIYRRSFQSVPNYSFSTGMGLFKSIINFVFLLAANKIAKLLGEGGIM